MAEIKESRGTKLLSFQDVNSFLKNYYGYNKCVLCILGSIVVRKLPFSFCEGEYN